MPIVTNSMRCKDYPQATARLTGQAQFENRTIDSTGSNFMVHSDTQTFGQAGAAGFEYHLLATTLVAIFSCLQGDGKATFRAMSLPNECCEPKPKNICQRPIM